MVRHDDAVIEKVAIAMRECWGKLDPDTTGALIPWEESKVQAVWLKIAKVGIETYEREKE